MYKPCSQTNQTAFPHAASLSCGGSLNRAAKLFMPASTSSSLAFFSSSTSLTVASHYPDDLEGYCHYVLRTQEAVCGLLERIQTIQQALKSPPSISLLKPEIIELLLQLSPSCLHNERTVSPKISGSPKWLQARLPDAVIPACESRSERQLDTTITLWRRSGRWNNPGHKSHFQPRNP